jgi:hypothetical protein
MHQVELLKMAAEEFGGTNDPYGNKIPWKKVSEFIEHNGGSYRFGNATCRKKYDELIASESAK